MVVHWMPSPNPRAVVPSNPDKILIQSVLEQDRVWSAYALADLDPEHDGYCAWYVKDDAVLLRYEGLQPPILFAQGPGDIILTLCAQLAPQTYQISFPVEVLESLAEKMGLSSRIPMLRMQRIKPIGASTSGTELSRLTAQDLPAIEQLYHRHPDAPDGYHPRQVELGPFVGAWDHGTLVATAGIHVLSIPHSVAAIGNVFTHPDWRKRGFARACTRSVLLELERLHIATVVLNVAQGNIAATRLYQDLGFQIYRPFFEGLLQIP